MTHRKHFTALDGLRGVAAVSVVIFHRRTYGLDGHALDHGFLAVNFFFLLSGFVIDHAYRARLQAGMRFADFVRIRFLRLYPLIATGALLGLGYAVLFALVSKQPQDIPAYAAAFFFTLLCVPAPSFLVPLPFFINRPTWSLFFELIANLIYCVGLYRLSTRSLAAVCAALSIASMFMIARFGTLNLGYEFDQLGWGILVVMTPFATGMLLSRLKNHLRAPNLPFWLVSILLVLTFVPREMQPGHEIVYQALVSFAAFPALIALGVNASVNGRWQSAAAWSGYISYALYATHYPILQFISGVGKVRNIAPFPVLVVIVICCVAFSWVAARYIDEPVRRWLGRQFTPSKRLLPESQTSR